MPHPNHFAVCVGINHYPEFRPLNGAENDAIRFSKWLLNPDEGGLPADQVETILLDPGEDRSRLHRLNAKPSRDQVFHWLSVFQRRFKQRLDDDPYAWDTSRLYIYLSGHGLSSDIQDAALLLANALSPISAIRNTLRNSWYSPIVAGNARRSSIWGRYP
jgi:hypothetical protein